MKLVHLFSDSLLLLFQKKYLLNSWQKWTFFSKHNQYNRGLRSLHSSEKAALLKSRTTLHQTNYQPGSVIICFARMPQWVQLNRINKNSSVYKDRNCTQETFSFQQAFSHKALCIQLRTFLIAVFSNFKYHSSFAQCSSFVPTETHLAW